MIINPRSTWRRRFALLPVKIGRKVYWLRHYWSQPYGDCTRVELRSPFTLRPEGALITAVSGDGDPYVKVRFKNLHQMQDWHEALIKGVSP